MRVRQYGFTIIELAVILAVIGIILAVAAPAHIRAKQIRAARSCQENLALIDGAGDAYAIQNNLSTDAPVRMDDLVRTTGTGFLRQIPVCPYGGTYTVNRIGDPPRCSLGQNDSARYAPHVYSSAVPRT